MTAIQYDRQLIDKTFFKSSMPLSQNLAIAMGSAIESEKLIKRGQAKKVNYAIPRGFYSGDRLNETIKTLLKEAQLINEAYSPVERLTVVHNYAHDLWWGRWFVNNDPLYCIKPDLLNALVNTDILSADVLKIKPAINSCVIALPTNSLFTDEGDPLPFLLINRVHRDNPNLSIIDTGLLDTMKDEFSDHISVSAVYIENGFIAGQYNNSVIFNRDGKFFIPGSEHKREIANVALNILLLLSQKPEIVQDMQPHEVCRPMKAKGFKQQPPLIIPRWLDHPTVIKRDRRDCGGTHASPRTHLRRGHWRHLANGKVVWIQPTYINLGKATVAA